MIVVPGFPIHIVGDNHVGPVTPDLLGDKVDGPGLPGFHIAAVPLEADARPIIPGHVDGVGVGVVGRVSELISVNRAKHRLNSAGRSSTPHNAIRRHGHRSQPPVMHTSMVGTFSTAL